MPLEMPRCISKFWISGGHKLELAAMIGILEVIGVIMNSVKLKGKVTGRIYSMEEQEERYINTSHSH